MELGVSGRGGRDGVRGMESFRRSLTTLGNPSLGAFFGTPPGRPGLAGRPPKAGGVLGMTNLPKRATGSSDDKPSSSNLAGEPRVYRRRGSFEMSIVSSRPVRRHMVGGPGMLLCRDNAKGTVLNGKKSTMLAHLSILGRRHCIPKEEDSVSSTCCPGVK